MVAAFLRGFIAAIALAAALALGVAYFGAYDVAASTPHNPLVGWYLKTVMRNAVRNQASQAPAAPPSTPEAIAKGFREFDEHCVQCHGAPGVDPSPAGRGLRPQPPDLARTGREWPEERIFWVVKHGIKMTGMPAWGKAMPDDETWAIADFVKHRLAQLDAAGYRAMRAKETEQEGKTRDEGANPQPGGRAAEAEKEKAPAQPGPAN